MSKKKEDKKSLLKLVKKLDVTTEWKKRNPLLLKISKLHDKLMKIEDKERKKENRTGEIKYRAVAVGFRGHNIRNRNLIEDDKDIKKILKTLKKRANFTKEEMNEAKNILKEYRQYLGVLLSMLEDDLYFLNKSRLPQLHFLAQRAKKRMINMQNGWLFGIKPWLIKVFLYFCNLRVYHLRVQVLP